MNQYGKESLKGRQNIFHFFKVQGDQLNMAVETLEKVSCQVYICTIAYTGQVTFFDVPEHYGLVYLVIL